MRGNTFATTNFEKKNLSHFPSTVLTAGEFRSRNGPDLSIGDLLPVRLHSAYVRNNGHKRRVAAAAAAAP